MRSRYTAYVLENVPYIIETHDPETRDTLDEREVSSWSSEADWIGLEVIETKDGGEKDETGEVEFVCRYEMDGKIRNHRERSTFRRREGRWFFHEGEIITAKPITREGPKIGRNDPCPCGSGKKHKRCCGQARA